MEQKEIQLVLPDITVTLQDINKQTNYIVFIFKEMINNVTKQISVADSLKLQSLWKSISDAYESNSKEINLIYEDFKNLQTIVLKSNGVGNYDLQLEILRIFEKTNKEYLEKQNSNTIEK